MARLIPAATFDDVYQLEVTDQVLGGFGGKSNVPNQNLTNRTEWLKARALASLRMENIMPITGSHTIVAGDIGNVLSVHTPAGTSFVLPALAGFPKGNPFTIVITDDGSGTPVPITANGSEIIENWLNAGGTSVFNAVPGTRLTMIATVTSWVIILLTTPVAAVSGYQPGDIAYSANPTLSRSGFFLCDGSLKSRSTYAALFAAIGTTFGVGDGSTTFAVPDHRDLFTRVWNGGGSGYDTGRAFGTYQADALKDHKHQETASTTGGGSSGIQANPGNGIGDVYLLTEGVYGVAGGAIETRPKNIGVNSFIKY